MGRIGPIAKNIRGVEDDRLVNPVDINGTIGNFPYLEEIVQSVVSRCTG
jgi:hypothetical protein